MAAGNEMQNVALSYILLTSRCSEPVEPLYVNLPVRLKSAYFRSARISCWTSVSTLFATSSSW